MRYMVVPLDAAMKLPHALVPSRWQVLVEAEYVMKRHISLAGVQPAGYLLSAQ